MALASRNSTRPASGGGRLSKDALGDRGTAECGAFVSFSTRGGSLAARRGVALLERAVERFAKKTAVCLAFLCCLLCGTQSSFLGWFLSASPVFAEATLNVHSCVSDFVISSLRDVLFVTLDQTVPERVALPVCDSISGPQCPHLAFPASVSAAAVSSSQRRRVGKGGGEAALPDVFDAYVHRFPLPLPSRRSDLPAAALSVLHPLSRREGGPVDWSRTHIPTRVLSGSKTHRHHPSQRYVNQAQFLEDGVGDVSVSSSLSDALSTAIGHLGGGAGVMSDIWARSAETQTEAFLCFHEGNPQDRRDCHDAADFSAVDSLSSSLSASIVSQHAGWSGASHVLTFDRSRAPFFSAYLESDFSWGLPPEAETKWQGLWRVQTAAGLFGTDDFAVSSLPPVPLAGPLAEELARGGAAPPTSVSPVKRPSFRVETAAVLESAEGSFFHSSLFVPFGLWLAFVPWNKSSSSECSGAEEFDAAAREAVVVQVQGLQEDSVVFTAEIPAAKIKEAREKRFSGQFLNALNLAQPSPWQRIDMLAFSYAIPSKKKGRVAKPLENSLLECLDFRVALAGLHLLLPFKVSTDKYFYAVDRSTELGAELYRQAQQLQEHRQQQERQKVLVAEQRKLLLQQLIGTNKVPQKRPSLKSSQDAGEDAAGEDKGSGYFLGAVFRSQGEHSRLAWQNDDPLLLSKEPLSWQENKRIKFGKFDSLSNQFADLRIPLKSGAVLLQDVPAEAPVVPLNRLPYLGLIFDRVPSMDSVGRVETPDGESAGVADVHAMMEKIIESLTKTSQSRKGEAKKSSSGSAAAANEESKTQKEKHGSNNLVVSSSLLKSIASLGELLEKGDSKTPEGIGGEASAPKDPSVKSSPVEAKPEQQNRRAQASQKAKVENADGEQAEGPGSSGGDKEKISKGKGIAAFFPTMLLVGHDGQVVDLASNTNGPVELPDFISKLAKGLQSEFEGAIEQQQQLLQQKVADLASRVKELTARSTALRDELQFARSNEPGEKAQGDEESREESSLASDEPSAVSGASASSRGGQAEGSALRDAAAGGRPSSKAKGKTGGDERGGLSASDRQTEGLESDLGLLMQHAVKLVNSVGPKTLYSLMTSLQQEIHELVDEPQAPAAQTPSRSAQGRNDEDE